MNLQYWQSDIGNFGDDLNPWLWEKIFGDFNQYNDDYDFVGIGSMLDERRDCERKQIIFGAGVRNFLYTPKFRNEIDIRFVRGPISSKVFGGPYITDAAYCLGLLPRVECDKKYKVAYMPYFRHVPFFNWKLFEKWSGIKIILPTNPVDQILKEINESESLLTSAMHGAIVADVYRIPWARVKFSSVIGEDTLTSELKWFDWHSSMNIPSLEPICFGFSLNHPSQNIFNDFSKTIFISRKLKKYKLYISEQSLYDEKIYQLRKEVEYMKNQYKKK